MCWRQSVSHPALPTVMRAFFEHYCHFEVSRWISACLQRREREEGGGRLAAAHFQIALFFD